MHAAPSPLRLQQQQWMRCQLTRLTSPLMLRSARRSALNCSSPPGLSSSSVTLPAFTRGGRPYSSASFSGAASTSTSAGAVKPEVISLDCIEVMTSSSSSGSGNAVAGNEGGAASARSGHNEAFPVTAARAAEASTRGPDRADAYCDVHAVDPFARGRVINFIRRMGKVDGEVFHVREVSSASVLPTDKAFAAVGKGEESPTTNTTATTTILYVATCRVPLPEPHLHHVAEGLGQDRKEAELLAAMHAERVCDALGVPLFRLKTAQQKHAETVRSKEGRYAPFPGDPVKPLGTPMPPPLRLLRARSSGTPSASAASAATAAPPFVVVKTATGPRKPGPPRRDIVGAAHATSVGADRAPGDADVLSPPPQPQPSHHNAAASPVPSAAANKPAEQQPPNAHKFLFSPDGDDNVHASTSAQWPTKQATTFLSRDPTLNETRQHDPHRLYEALVPHYTDAEHDERVRTYASTVVYPWHNTWEASESAPGLPSPPDAQATHAAAAAAAAMVASSFDHTENGLWQLTNDRNMRASPTPELALVLPYVYDGPYALQRITDYYAQHGSTVENHLRVRSVVAAGTVQRWVEAELSLFGVSVAAKGKAQTEEMALRLAAMHAELLLDALGLALFPKDDARQAQHAEAVAGYGRWAMNPLTGDVTPPNPHDALPLPLKQRVGVDELWLAADAAPQVRKQRTEDERIVAAHNFIEDQSEDNFEVNPPEELLEEAYTMLQEWQTHIARSRYTNLYVLFDLNADVYRASTLLPVPARFGLRGGCGIALTRKKAVQLCALHAMDTLCLLGVPLCVDAAEERRYLQRRAALGMVLPGSLGGAPLRMPRTDTHFSSRIGMVMRCNAQTSRESVAYGEAASLPSNTSDSAVPVGRQVPYLPMYVLDTQQVRLPAPFVDSMHVVGLLNPHDYCLFRAEKDAALTDAGNEAKTCVTNYIEHYTAARMRERNAWLTSMRLPRPQYPGFKKTSVMSNNAAQEKQKDRGNVAVNAEPPVLDEITKTQLWAAQYAQSLPPFAVVTGFASNTAVHTIAYLQLPLPDTKPKKPIETSAATEKEEELSTRLRTMLSPKYIIATGVSLKRKDAARACYVHAAALLHELGIDVLAAYTANAPRTRLAPNFAALQTFLDPGMVVVVPPYTADSQPNQTPLHLLEERNGEPGQPRDTGARISPRPVMHNLFKKMLEDPRHVTLKKRRTPPTEKNPFTAKQKQRLF